MKYNLYYLLVMDAIDSPLERAIRLAGSESRLAAAIGYSQVAVNKARRRGAVSPAGRPRSCGPICGLGRRMCRSRTCVANWALGLDEMFGEPE